MSNFVFNKKNYYWLLGGIGAILIGFLLMIGGASEDPKVFNGDELFSHRRITLAPFLVIAGYVVVIYAIMRKPKGEQ